MFAGALGDFEQFIGEVKAEASNERKEEAGEGADDEGGDGVSERGGEAGVDDVGEAEDSGDREREVLDRDLCLGLGGEFGEGAAEVGEGDAEGGEGGADDEREEWAGAGGGTGAGHGGFCTR